MKKRISLFIATVATLVALPAATFAVPVTEGGITDVAGTVTSNGSPVSGASVSVNCNGNILTSGTTAAGGYIVQFPASECPDGSTAHVTASKGGGSGSKSGTVNGLTADINLAIINVSIPEFGVIAGVSAAILGSGAFLAMRRRQLHQS